MLARSAERRERPRPAGAPGRRPPVPGRPVPPGLQPRARARRPGTPRRRATTTGSTGTPAGSCTSTRTSSWCSATTRRRTTGCRSRPPTSARSGTTRSCPCPPPEFELALFVVRMMLKHATWDAVAMGTGQPLGQGERRELAWLLERAGPRQTRAVVVAEHLGGIGVELWERCLTSLTDGTRPRGAGSPGRRARSPRPRPARAPVPTGRRGTRVLTREGTGRSGRYVLRRPDPQALRADRLTVAVVGGDGSGKTTAVEGVADLARVDLRRTPHPPGQAHAPRC